ncbi:timeless-domain-containing protein [Laetiporus sulphureus 93-53]|uniref:Timeless-domain-containing protein n=1 Tax=Laetiporus sulphureus 93-53 TaxID=1314785 RepID=A0A165F4A2_9APHY|nr:timeless-domain-containing protein [Laetiporus sulphureus 93-53]KZT08354.1 timeless-domain-containing protein [Laetiporus sulphureus 93-53]
MDEDAISISLEPSDEEEFIARRAILEPAIRNVVHALGGYEGGSYRLGDECYGCLKDLKKLWRKDDTDDDRTVARIFWETRLLPNDLIPIILETAGKGHLEDKCAIACADLMTAMTWPIDLAEELKELDEVYDKAVDYTQLLISHLYYKAALLRPGVMPALFGIVLPCLAKDEKERKERDIQIISVVLYLIRNLAFIRDMPPNMHLSSDRAELSSQQTQLIKVLSDSNIFDFLLTIASNIATDAMFNRWNALVLEILYLLFRGVKPSSLAMNQVDQPTQSLRRLLAAEDQRKRNLTRTATSRHSRFGTTIAVKLNSKKAQSADKGSAEGQSNLGDDPQSSSQTYVLHRQQAINRDAGSILDLAKRHRSQKGPKADELAHDDNLTVEAKSILQNLARTFVEACFNPFVSSLLKDIKAERPKITEKDNLRLLYVTKWLLEFFLAVRAKEGQNNNWKFGLIAEVTDRQWIIWVLRRMREASEDKPKLWNELQAGIECLTQLILVIDSMSSATDADVVEAADTLQQQIIYNGEVLDIAFESLRTYKQGTQSLAYLDSSVYLAYAIFRMLERWGKKRGGAAEMYVRRKAKAKKRRNDGGASHDEDAEREEEEETIHETMFTLDMFESKFAHTEVTCTLLAYLARYKESSSAEKMKRVVSLMHRQAVKAKAEGLFFNVSTLSLFKAILTDKKTLPKDRPYQDLINFIDFVLRRFFKSLEDEPLLMVEAFFPMNRGHWKQYSSWEPEKRILREDHAAEDSRFPPDVQVQKGYSWSEQLAIVIAHLLEAGKAYLIDWVQEILMLVIGQRQRIIDDTDDPSVQSHEDAEEERDETAIMKDAEASRGPSTEVLAKFTDYMIPYINDERAKAATRDPHFKLLFRLVKFDVVKEDADELEWYIPAAILPSELQRSLNVIRQFLEKPLDLGGKKASQLFTKKTRRRRRHSPLPDANDDQSDDVAPRRQRKEKKAKEKQQYKSAQFIEDSDAEYGDMESFLEKEKMLREKTALAASASGHVATMRRNGTKKRVKKNAGDEPSKRRRKRRTKVAGESEMMQVQNDADESDESELNVFGSPKKSPSPLDSSSHQARTPRPRPRPRFLAQRRPEDEDEDVEPRAEEQSGDSEAGSPSPNESLVDPANISNAESYGIGSPIVQVTKKKRRLQLVDSDEED